MTTTTNTSTFTSCTMRGHTVGIKLFGPQHCRGYAVGVDGWLVGNYDDPDQAIAAAREQVRMLGGGVMGPPSVSQRFRDAVHALSIDR
jgi:hypothetical protein